MIVKTYEIWAKEGDAPFCMKLRFYNKEYAEGYKNLLEIALQTMSSVWLKQYNAKSMQFLANIVFTKGDILELRESFEAPLFDEVHESYLEVQHSFFIQKTIGDFIHT